MIAAAAGAMVIAGAAVVWPSEEHAPVVAAELEVDAGAEPFDAGEVAAVELVDAGVAVAKVEPPPPEPPPTPKTNARTTKQQPATGLFSLESNAPVSVSLKGKSLGTTPLSRVKLPVGTHTLRLSNAALGLSRTLRVRVDRGEVTAQKITFGKGELNVSVHPWADVWLNGKKIGQTPLAARSVWEGQHRLRLVGPSGEKTISVQVAAGQSVAVREALP